MADVRVPENPRVRFFAKTPDASAPLKDVTGSVARLILEDLEDESGYCILLRLDDKNELVWKTKHPSVQEAKWHVEFEYGLPEEKWQTYKD